MFHSRRKTRRRFDAAARVRKSRSRRLSIEAMESRLLLSGNQPSNGDLDYTIWNLDSLQNNYEIISQGESLPAAPASTSSASGPAGTALDVSWVPVPGMLASLNDAKALAYRQYRDAQSQGVLNFQQSSELLNEYRAGFTPYTGSDLVQVFAVGIRNHFDPTLITSSDSNPNSNTLDSLKRGAITSVVDTSVLPTPTSPVVPKNPVLPTSPAPRVSTDILLAADLNQNGVVSTGDYTAWRDTIFAPDSDLGTFDANSVGADTTNLINISLVNDVRSSLELGSVGVSPTSLAKLADMLEIARKWRAELTAGLDSAGTEINVSSHDLATDSSTANVPLLTAPAVEIAALEDAATLATAALPSGGAITWQVIYAAPISNPLSEVATVAESQPESPAANETNDDPHVVAAPVAPATSDIATAPTRQTVPTRQTGQEDDLAGAIDQLLADEVIIVHPSGDTSADGTVAEQAVANSTPADAPLQADQPVVAAAVDHLAEGGMIPIEQVLDATTGEADPAALADAPLSADGEGAELAGEISRVAVMELIQGESEPGTAPADAADQVTLIAEGGSGESLEAAQVVAREASLAVSLVSPVNPVYLTTIADAAGRAFSAVVGTELGARLGLAAHHQLPAEDAARSEAFSQLGANDAEQTRDAEAPTSSRWLAASPLLVALACERAIAIQKKRRQRNQAGDPAGKVLKPQRPSTDAR